MITHVHGLKIGDVVEFGGLAHKIIEFPNIHLVRLEPGGVVSVTELKKLKRKNSENTEEIIR